jgi:hypothetical protein
VLAILAMPAPGVGAARGSGWLRSSLPLCCAPWPMHGQAGTGKQALWPNRKANPFGYDIALRIEHDRRDRRSPVTGLCSSPSWKLA